MEDEEEEGWKDLHISVLINLIQKHSVFYDLWNIKNN